MVRPRVTARTVIVPVAVLNRATLRELAYARSLSDSVIAVHVTDDVSEATQLRERWAQWAQEASEAAERLSPKEVAACTLAEVQLVLLESPYRSLTPPLLSYTDQLEKQESGSAITIVLPEALPTQWWLWGFHNQTALRLKAALLLRPSTAVLDVPLHVEV